jgi:murein DD-endopeptidase MepM/ murein hydrolase activator NlpD
MKRILPLTTLALTLAVCNPTRPPAPAPTYTSTVPATPTPTPTLLPTPTPTLRPTSTLAPTLGPTSEPWVISGRHYYFPVQPPGIATYANEHHDYPATDIFVPGGTVVVAVTGGVVDEVSRVDRWDPATNDGAFRGGLWVSIIGDDGVRYYTSHLSSVDPAVEPGVRVHAGQVIGLSGCTGNATPTPPHVHFGISHPTFPGDWAVRRGEIWPYEYLQAWARGDDVTPALP